MVDVCFGDSNVVQVHFPGEQAVENTEQGKVMNSNVIQDLVLLPLLAPFHVAI